MHHQHAVGHGQQLRHLGGDHDDGYALLAQIVQQAIDVRLCSHVDAPGGFVQDDDLGRDLQPLRQDHLLLVAAGQCARKCVAAARLDRQLVDPLCHGLPLPGVADDEAVLAGFVIGRHHVARHRLDQHQALGLALHGHEGQAGLQTVLRTGELQRLAIHFDLSLGAVVAAEQRLAQLVVAGTHQAVHAQNLALAQRQRNVLHVAIAQMLRLQHHIADLGMPIRIHVADLATHHQADQLVLGGVLDALAGHGHAVAQHHHAVGHGKDFVHLVGDEHHADAVFLQHPDLLQQVGDFCLVQRGGGLVQNQDAGLFIDGARDLDLLLLRHGALRHLLGHVDLQPDGRDGLLRLAVDLLPAQNPALSAVGVDVQVLRNGELRHVGQLLIHHGDARALGGVRRRKANLLAVDVDVPGIRLVGAGQYLDQGGLACAVFAQQRHHLAGVHLQRNVAQRLDSGKGFGDFICS